MGLFRRRPPTLPLSLPRPDGAGWPDRAETGRPSFEGATYYELGTRNAFEPEAHDLADRLVDAVLPRLATGVTEEDEPYLRKTFLTAARIGAGVGMAERSLATPIHLMDRHVAAALWLARRKLPAMRADWSRTGAYFMLAGYYLARTDLDLLPALVQAADEAGGVG
ncbi:MAG: hypothetical protein M3P93_02980 [Actinomycetota bacterium]|nr:hypothetical protein [Actinomycetota bacterium]